MVQFIQIQISVYKFVGMIVVYLLYFFYSMPIIWDSIYTEYTLVLVTKTWTSYIFFKYILLPLDLFV